jgi:AcrR family transcriptional regulator
MTTTSRPRSRRGSGEQLREAMLTAAADLLDTSCDVESLSVRTVTAATGVSPTALYLHFEDKAALVHAVKQRCIAALGAALRAAIEAAGSPAPHTSAEVAAAAAPAALPEAASPEAGQAEGGTRARLRAISHAYLGYAAAHPGHYAMLFHITPSADGATNEPPEDIQRTSAELFGLLVGVIAEQLDEAKAFEAASGLWISLHGRAHISRAMPWFGLPDQDRYVDLLVDQILG